MLIGRFDQHGNMIQYSGEYSDYDGTKTGAGDELKNWLLTSPDPNMFMAEHLLKLQCRQFSLYLSYPLAKASINKPLSYSIGDGLLFRSNVNASYLGWTPAQAKEFSRKFTELLHYEKLHINYYEKQSIIQREALIMGDSLLYFLYEGNEDGRPFDLYCESGIEINGTKNTDGYILGVKVDDFKRKKGIVRILKNQEVLFTAQGNQKVLICGNYERPGQVRGYGRNLGIISQMKQYDRIWDAVVARMVQEAVQYAYFQASETDVKGQVETFARLQNRGKSTGISESGTDVTKLTEVDGGDGITPGLMYLLKNSENLKFTDMKAPSGNFGIANEWFLNMVGMNSGFAPEFILGKYSTSYTAHKGALNDTWKVILRERKNFCRNIDNAVNRQYLKYFIEKDLIELPNGDKNILKDYRKEQALLAGKWLGPVPGHINPNQEVAAQIQAEQAGYVSKADVAALHGTDDWWAFIDEWEEQQDRFNAKSAKEQLDILIPEDEKNTKEQDDNENQGVEDE